ncbi:MAG: long-chain fatty acid--CoA ligase [Candidatus Omnitrophica bacterium]|nr:long-chain fatty acid--CoA ligase [Candidatus Omnitrophota bacterium]
MEEKRMPDNLVEMLERSSSLAPQKVALYFMDREITYGGLWEMSGRFAQGLKNLGLSKKRVAIFLHNLPEFVIAYFGIIKAQSSVVPINYMFKEEETEYILKDSGAFAIITSVSCLGMIRPIKERLNYMKHIILIDGIIPNTLNFYEIIERTTKRLVFAQIDKDAVASVLYTSGTTGHPKGAQLSHYNFLSNCFACSKTIKVKNTDNIICLLPMFHSFAWTASILLALYSGASITILDSVRPFRKVIRNIIKKKVTVFVGIPSIYQILSHIHIPAIFTSRVLEMIRPLRLCISGAAALPVAVLKNFEGKFHIPLLEGYGLTETAPVVSLNPLKRQKPGSVGLPLENVKTRIVDDNGAKLAKGRIGELAVFGPNVMKGYLNNKEATQECIKDGWLYTGDMARIDEDGYIYIVDRKKDMINVRGLNVYPREVEDMLAKHPAVKEAAVVKMPDKHKGEVPRAFIILKRGSPISQKEIISFCRRHLADFKVPRRIEFVTDFPRNLTGKVLKRCLTG